MKIRFGKNPTPPKPRSWSIAMGFSGIEWLAPNGWTLNQPPRVGEKQWIKISANFVSELGQALALYWLPADSAINGFDDNNMAELTELRFVYGVLTGHDPERQTIELQPRKIETLLDLCRTALQLPKQTR